MADFTVIRTGDPNWNPNERVTINGFVFVPLSEHQRRVDDLLEANNRYLARAREAEQGLTLARAAANGLEIWSITQTLTEDEGNTVTVLCPNPDWNGQPSYAIECCGDWTNWKPIRFAHDDRAECFRLALAAFNSARAEAKAALQ